MTARRTGLSSWIQPVRAGALLVVLGAAGCEAPRTVAQGTWDGWASGDPPARVPLRVVSYNVEGLGTPSTPGFDALVDVLTRIDADVIALNEVDGGEDDALDALAAALGHDGIVLDGDPAFGDLRNAVLSRVPIVASDVLDGRDLAAPDTRDLTRGVVVVRVAVPGTGLEVGVAAMHLKSGFEAVDSYRRAVDALRVTQAAATLDGSDLALVVGDVNAEVGQRHDPVTFTAEPDDLPDSWSVGADVLQGLGAEGLDADPFAEFAAEGWRRVPLTQRDGDAATRPESGRVIDHVLVDDRADRTPLRGEVYDCDDDTEVQPGVADGPALGAVESCARASDHRPVVVELSLSADG